MALSPLKSPGEGIFASVKQYARVLFPQKKLLKSDTTKISTGRGGVGNFMCSSPVEPESKGHVYSDEAAVRVHTSLFFTYLG